MRPIFHSILILVMLVVSCSHKATDQSLISKEWLQFQCFDLEFAKSYEKYERLYSEINEKRKKTKIELEEYEALSKYLDRMDKGYEVVISSGEKFEIGFVRIRSRFPEIAKKCKI
jgi:competence protein ComGF